MSSPGRRVSSLRVLWAESASRPPRQTISSGTRAPLVVLLSVAGLARLSAQHPPNPPAHDVFAYVRALDAAGSRAVWPGFDPAAWPIALFDGERTILLRHPSPPPEFEPMPGRPGVLVAPGRHPAVVTNSTRELGGTRTATVIATPERSVESTTLAIVEEVFHVFWLSRHPAFRPNEMARYAYPVTDESNLRGLLAEEEALARGIEADSEGEAASWAAAALRIRQERSVRLEPGIRDFERSLEMMEGTANYTARRSLGQPGTETAARLRAARAAEAVRWRFYDTGAALGYLLDRLAPDWKERSAVLRDLTMEQQLDEALSRRGVAPGVFSEREVESFGRRAASDVAEYVTRAGTLRQDLLARWGFRVVVEAGGKAEPLQIERFDPMQLFVVGAGEVAQAHYLSLRSGQGSVELVNPDFSRNSFAGTVALTVSAGRHPLTDGVRTVTVVGIEGAPEIVREADTVRVHARGLKIELRGAQVSTEGEEVRIAVTGR